MKTKFFIFGIIISIISSITACYKSPGNELYVSRVSAASHLNANVEDVDKAELLAKDAEELLQADGFLEAKRVATLALKLDPHNLRAGFIYNFLNILSTFKGYFTRFKPLNDKYPEFAKESQEFESKVRTSNKQSLIKFLEQGEPDIDSEEKVQQFYDDFGSAILEFQKFLELTKDQELTLKPHYLFINDINSRFVNACEIIETANLEFELKCPEDRIRHQVTMNQADFELLKDMSNFYYVSVGFLTSYKFNGYLEVANRMAANQVRLTGGEKYNQLLENNPQFGKLRNRQILTETRKRLKEIIISLNWIMENQATLCPKGDASAANRLGMFFNHGVCLHPMMMSYLQQWEGYLSGKPEKIESAKEGHTYKTEIYYTALFDNPVSDLRSLGPIKFNACDGVVSVGDLSLGGMFPNNDANTFILNTSEKCSK